MVVNIQGISAVFAMTCLFWVCGRRTWLNRHWVQLHFDDLSSTIETDSDFANIYYIRSDWTSSQYTLQCHSLDIQQIYRVLNCLRKVIVKVLNDKEQYFGDYLKWTVFEGFKINLDRRCIILFDCHFRHERLFSLSIYWSA